MRFRFFLLLLTLSWAWTLFAEEEETVPAEAPSWKTLEVQATADHYPDADSVLLYDSQVIRYEPDGTSRERDDFYIKILTEKGIRANRVQNMYFNTAYGSARFVRAEIFRATLPPIDVDPEQRTSTAVDPSQMGNNIYDPNSKVLSLNIPDLQVGDTLHIVTETRTEKPRIPGVWSDIIALQSTDPILFYEFVVDAPQSCPVHTHAIKDPVPETVQFAEQLLGDRIRYTWTVRNVPQVFPEPNMPPLYSCAQRLLMSTAPDWQTISRWYYNLSLPHLNAVTPAMKKKVAELVQGADTTREKIKRIFRFVSQEVRYMGITTETAAPGYEPHDVNITFDRRYGVCRDKAALLTSMLQLAGIRAWPVLFMAGAPKDQEVPNSYFNHAITAAEPVPGKYILLDPTYENTMDFLPASEAEMSFLAATEEGDTLRLSPPVDPKRNALNISLTGNMGNDGRNEFQMEMTFSGVNDQTFRSVLAQWPQEKRRESFASQLKKLWPGARLKELSILPQNIRDTSQALKIIISFNSNNGFGPLPDDLLIRIPDMLQNFGFISSEILESVGLPERKYPLQIYACSDFSSEFSLKLPEGMQLEALPEEKFSRNIPGITLEQEVSFAEKTLRATCHLQVAQTRFSPEEYRELKRMLQEREKFLHAVCVFRNTGNITDPGKAFPEADVIYLQAAADFNVTAPAAGKLTEHRRILVRNYAGVKRCSELQIPFNPAMDAVPEITGTVISPSGTERKLRPEEINIMDQPWVTEAPRYPAGKLLTVSFPGVKPGSIIDYTSVKTFRHRPWCSFLYTFGGYDPVLEEKLSVHWPQSYKPVEFLSDPSLQRQGNVFRSSVRPAIPLEPGQPDMEDLTASWGFSGFNWKEYAEALQKVLLEKCQKQEASARLARTLCKGKSDEDDKITTIRNYVLRNIRLAGPDFYELPWSSLTAADRVLSDGYGNSADRAILLKTMLDAVGIPAKFVAVSDREYTQKHFLRMEAFPQVWQMGTILVAAGSSAPPRYLNAGTDFDAPGTNPADDHIALDLQKGELFTLEARHPERDLVLIFDITLQPDGSANIRYQKRYYGAEFGKMAKYLAELTPELKRRYVNETVAALSQNAVLQRAMDTQFERYPGVRELQIHIPDFAVKTGNLRQMELPHFWTFANVISTADSQRDTPYERREGQVVEVEYRITFPENWQPVQGQTLDQDQLLERVRIRRSVKGNVLKVTGHVELRPGVLDVWQYNDLERLQSQLQLPEMRTVLFRVLTKP